MIIKTKSKNYTDVRKKLLSCDKSEDCSKCENISYCIHYLMRALEHVYDFMEETNEYTEEDEKRDAKKKKPNLYI